MKRIAALALGVVFCQFLRAENDDLFREGVVDEIEVDRNFEDDFAHIEEPQATSDARTAIILPLQQNWDGRSIIRRERSVSVLTGGSDIAHAYHLTIFPQVRFDVWRLFAHVGYPFHFPVYDNGISLNPGGLRHNGFVAFKEFFIPRKLDFTGWPDLQRVVRHVEVGSPSDRLFLRLSRSHAISLGQGVLVNEMVPNGLTDQDYLFGKAHAAFDSFHLDGFLGPLPLVEMAGINARFIPFRSIAAHPFIQGINTDVSYVGDFRAPNWPKAADNSFLLDEEKRLVERNKGTAQGISLGAASEYVPIGWLALTPYVSYGHLFLTGLQDPKGAISSTQGAGFHFGHDAKIFLAPGQQTSVLFLRTEGRFFTSKYWPGYFSSNYMVDRAIVGETNSDMTGADLVSKSHYLASKMDVAGRFGYELALAYFLGSILHVSVGYEGAHSLATGKQVPALRKLYTRAGFSALDVLRFNLGYETSFIKEMKYLFDFDRTRALLSLGGQVQLLPNLYFDAWAKHSFGINDMFSSANEGKAAWLAPLGERRRFDFGLGLEFAMTF